jgi:hypothetical protein
MKSFVLINVAIFALLLTSCEEAKVPDDKDAINLTSYYKTYNFDFVSRIHYYKEDTLNYSEVKIENLYERSGKLNFIASASRKVTNIKVAQTSGNELDLALQANSSVANTNYMANFIYGNNPYTSRNEWDFDPQSRLHIINYMPGTAFFPNYFGGGFAGYYNANQGANFTSTKKYPTANSGYCRNVNNRMLFVDMYRKNAFYENKVDSIWVEFPLPAVKNALSFDFETVDADYGIVAFTTADSLHAFSIQGTTTKYLTKTLTDKNQAFAGWDGAYAVAIYKNGLNKNQPYVVIRRNTVADIYKYDIVNSTLTEVYPNIPLPQMLQFSQNTTFGDCGRFHYFVFHGEKVMLFTGSVTFILQNNQFTEFKTNLPATSNSTITALESGPAGIYIAIQSLVNGKRIADIVLIK